MGTGAFTNLTVAGSVVTSFRSPGRPMFTPEPERKDPIKEELAYVIMKMQQDHVLQCYRNDDLEPYAVILLNSDMKQEPIRVSLEAYYKLIDLRRITVRHSRGKHSSYGLTTWLERQVLLFKRWLR